MILKEGNNFKMRLKYEIILLWASFSIMGFILGFEFYSPFPIYKETPKDSICLGCCTYECWVKNYKLHIIGQYIFPFFMGIIGIIIFYDNYLKLKERD